MIPYGRQHIDNSGIDAVMEVLTSDFLTQGPMVPRFEDAISKNLGRNLRQLLTVLQVPYTFRAWRSAWGEVIGSGLHLLHLLRLLIVDYIAALALILWI